MRTIGITTRNPVWIRACLAAAAASLIAGCGGGGDKRGITDPDLPSDAGTVSGQVSGDVTMSLGGGKSVVIIHDGPFLGITMGEPTKYTLIIQRENVAVPAPGTYQLADQADADEEPPADQFWAGLVASVGSQNASAALLSKSGTLTVTSSSASRVKGNFTAVLAGYRMNADGSETPVTATVTGSFDAPVARLSGQR